MVEITLKNGSKFQIQTLVFHGKIIDSNGTEWHISTSDTVAYAGTIADFKYTMSQTEQTLSPVYCKIDEETKSISNILVYDKYQEGLELTRIKNHLK